METINKSEVARIREQIALEYQASQRMFSDFTPTAKHQYITKRQENIAVCFQELQQYMTPAEAVAIVAQTLKDAQMFASASGNTS
ncbi:MAG TPA: hypothetical protein VFU49_24860 [Ktedonobacteraceae bacterium]|nr:hypothetical protein [Ktedonobacteraceae bacterium]